MKIKSITLAAVFAGMALGAMAQQLRLTLDNEDVIKAMTLEKKGGRLVGGGNKALTGPNRIIEATE